MSEPSKDNCVAILDREIDLVQESVKSATLETWALLAALGGILTLLATSWEAGGLNWRSVGLDVLGLFLVGDVLRHWIMPRRPSEPITGLFQRQRLQIGIPGRPIILGASVSGGLLALLIASKGALPTVVFYLGAAFLGLRIVILFIAGPFLARLQESRISFTDPKTPRWMLKPSFVKGYADGFRGGRGIVYPEAIVFIVVAAFAFYSAGWAAQGNGLLDARFAFLVYALVCVVTMLLHPTHLESLPGLVVLRRDLLANTITPTDAYLGVTLVQGGVSAAPAIIVGKQRVSAMTDAILQAVNEAPELLTNFRALPKEARQSDPLGAQIASLEGMVAGLRAEVHSSIIIRPEGDPALLGVLGEMERCLERLTLIVEAQEGEPKESTYRDRDGHR